jgi:hypothetical protein
VLGEVDDDLLARLELGDVSADSFDPSRDVDAEVGNLGRR